VAFLEELDGQDRGQAAEDVEVVPLDDVADGCGDDDATKLFGLDTLCSRHGPPLSLGSVDPQNVGRMALSMRHTKVTESPMSAI
jgi:hypothetical protein